MDFNGADLCFKFLLCSSDGWALAGSEKLKVASEIESDKLDKAEGIYLFSRMQGVNWWSGRCMGAVMEEGK